MFHDGINGLRIVMGEFIQNNKCNHNYYERKKTIVKKFEFIGNTTDQLKVEKVDAKFGDGDIYTEKGASTKFSISASLQQTSPDKVYFKLTYQVTEVYKGNRGKNCDDLRFTGTETFSLGRYIKNEQKREGDKTITTEVTCKLDPVDEASYEYTLQLNSDVKNYIKPRDSSPKYKLLNSPRPSELRGWLPEDKLEVVIDGSGSELTQEGNLRIKGEVRIPIEVNTEVTVTEDVVPVLDEKEPTKGGVNELDKQNLDVVSGILGRGYYIDRGYASRESLSDGFPFDLDKLNRYGRVEKTPGGEFEGCSFAATGVKEYTQKLEKSIGVKVSGGALGVSFSSDTQKSFSSEAYSKEGYKLYTLKDCFYYDKYKIIGSATPGVLTGFLSKDFRDDLNSYGAAQFINKYGTHVVLGMYMGGRVFYNMSYRQSLSKMTTAETFSTTNSIGYSSDGKVINNDPPKEKTAKDLLYELIDSTDDEKIGLDAIKKLFDEESKEEEKSKKAGGINGNVSVDCKESSSNSSQEESEVTRITCTAVGGDVNLLSGADYDLSRLEKWRASITPNNRVWCDFVSGTLVPIYEFIPAGYKLTVDDVKKAWEQYLEARSINIEPLNDIIHVYDREFSGANKCVNWAHDVKGRNEDADIYSQHGRRTGWKLFFKLINLTDNGSGCRVGVHVQLRVIEGGLDGTKSVIELRHTYEVSLGNCRQMAVDPACAPSCELEGEVLGQCHEWIDITNPKFKWKTQSKKAIEFEVQKIAFQSRKGCSFSPFFITNVHSDAVVLIFVSSYKTN